MVYFSAKRRALQLLAFVMTGNLTSCSDPKSELAGHFEDSDEETLGSFRHAQVAVPEHHPSQGVVMSLVMFTEHHLEELAVKLLATDIEKLWVVVAKDYKDAQALVDLKVLRDKVSAAGMTQGVIQLVRPKAEGALREWARDWGPLSAKTADGKLRFLDFNYYSSRPADDSIPGALAELMGKERVSIPVYNEGGNFMNNAQGDCLMTTRVVVANDEIEVPTDTVYNADEIKDFYGKYAGCRRTVIFPAMPYEGTRHIDLWAKFLDDQTVLVSEIRDELLPLATYNEVALPKTLHVKRYLDERAREIEGLGFTVVRIPMPLPYFGGYYPLFRSYTNSLLLNQNIFIPEYTRPFDEGDGPDGKYVDDAFLIGYQEEVRQIHGEFGHKAFMIPSDQLISKGGAVHCTTMQIAR